MAEVGIVMLSGRWTDSVSSSSVASEALDTFLLFYAFCCIVSWDIFNSPVGGRLSSWHATDFACKTYVLPAFTWVASQGLGLSVNVCLRLLY